MLYLYLPLCCYQVTEEAREEAREYRYLYSQPIPLKVCHTVIHSYPHVAMKLFCFPPPLFQVLVDRVSAFMHVYTLYSAVRPFGCSLMYGTYTSAGGPQLYMTDPSGVSWVSYCKMRWGVRESERLCDFCTGL